MRKQIEQLAQEGKSADEITKELSLRPERAKRVIEEMEARNANGGQSQQSESSGTVDSTDRETPED